MDINTYWYMLLYYSRSDNVEQYRKSPGAIDWWESIGVTRSIARSHSPPSDPRSCGLPALPLISLASSASHEICAPPSSEQSSSSIAPCTEESMEKFFTEEKGEDRNPHCLFSTVLVRTLEYSFTYPSIYYTHYVTIEGWIKGILLEAYSTV